MYISKYIGRSRSRDGFHSSQVGHGVFLDLLKKAGSALFRNHTVRALAKKAVVKSVKAGGNYLSKKIDNTSPPKKKQTKKATSKPKKVIKKVKKKVTPGGPKLRDIFSE